MKLAQKLLAENLKKFDELFKDSFKNDNTLLSKILQFISSHKGKHLRALLVLLSAKLCGKINDSTYRAACLVEYLHVATVIHNDIVDESYVRSKSYSIKALWDNKLAVIVGDYMFCKGLLTSIEGNDLTFLRILSTTIKSMSEGELLQYEKRIYGQMTEGIYYEVVDKRVASLFAATCSLGAYSSTKDVSLEKCLYQVGSNLGVAFQLKDDVYEYNKIIHTGKPGVRNLKNMQLTLPFIHAVKHLNESQSKKLLSIVSRPSPKNRELEEVIDLIVKAGGVDYSSQVMMQYAQLALDHLQQFPESLERLAFEDLIQYVIHRGV